MIFVKKLRETYIIYLFTTTIRPGNAHIISAGFKGFMQRHLFEFEQQQSFYSASLYNLLRKLKAIIKKKSFLSIIVKVDWHKVTKIADTN